MLGGEGDDILNGGLADDTLHGDGCDLFVTSAGPWNDIYDGGSGMEAGTRKLAFPHLTKNRHDLTVIAGNTGTDAFELKVQAHHELTNDQFNF